MGALGVPDPLRTVAQEREIAGQIRAARVAEFRAVISEAGTAADADRVRAVRRLQADLRRIAARDYFPPPEREAATTAVRQLSAEPADREPA